MPSSAARDFVAGGFTIDAARIGLLVVDLPRFFGKTVTDIFGFADHLLAHGAQELTHFRRRRMAQLQRHLARIGAGHGRAPSAPFRP